MFRLSVLNFLKADARIGIGRPECIVSANILKAAVQGKLHPES